MKAAGSRRDRIRAQLADLKMPGALEALDEVLTGVDGGGVTASEAIEQLLGAQIMLRNNRRLQAAMRSSRLPGIKTDRLLHHCHIVNIRGNSYRMRKHTDLSKILHSPPAEPSPSPPRRKRARAKEKSTT